MADATDAARLRLDAALAELEARARARASSRSTAAVEADDDLFARVPGDPAHNDRAVELEAAARDAAQALAEAAEALKDAMGAAR